MQPGDFSSRYGERLGSNSLTVASSRVSSVMDEPTNESTGQPLDDFH